MNVVLVPLQWVSNTCRLNIKPLMDVMDFERNELCLHNSKSRRIVYLREREATAQSSQGEIDI